MKIKYLKINGFGKIENKEIEFNNNINLIYGKNEAGKTTLLKCILAVLYGLSKNKNGKELSDFDKYQPWGNSQFSAKMKYQLDSGELIEVFREFAKKNPQIFDQNSENISKNFNIDKNKGNEFFYEQTKIDERMFLATGLIEQQGVVLNDKEKSILTQKITNLLSTGEENISYKKAIEKLNKDLIEKVGTERTTERPINLVLEKLQKIKKERKEIKEKEAQVKTIHNLKEQYNEEISEKKVYIERLKQLKEIKQKEILEKEKIKIKNDISLGYEEKIEKLAKENDIKKKKKHFEIAEIIIILLLSIGMFAINKILGIVVFVLNIATYLTIQFTRSRKNKGEQKSKEEYIKNISKKISEKEREILEEQKQLKEKIDEEKGKILLQLEEQQKLQLEKIFKKGIQELEKNINKEQEDLSNLRIELNKIEIEEGNAIKALEYKAKLEEKLISLEEERQELETLAKKIKLAKETLELAYIQMKKQITPKITANLSKIASKISDGKYENIKFNDTEGIFVELESGEYVNSNRLSAGTADQLYLSLRLSVFEEITQEKMPIILDEAFAYYDEERLKNVLEYLDKELKQNQVIIFTCTKREKQILDNAKIQYNYIEI